MTQERQFTDVELWAIEHAKLLTMQINESLQIANRSAIRDTKLSRLRIMEAKLAELIELARQHPFLRLERLEQVRESIRVVAKEALALPAAPSFVANSGAPLEIARANRDLIKGLEFHATLQMRTPLSVLKRHGKLHKNLGKEPPVYAKEPWQGIWTTPVKTSAELGGVDLPQYLGDAATDIGPVPNRGEAYWRYLIELKTIAADRTRPIGIRRLEVEAAAAKPEWAEFSSCHGGPRAVASMLLG